MRRKITAVAALAFIATVTPATAGEFTPRAIISWQTFQSGDLTTSGLRQTYDLRLQKELTEPCTVRLFFRGEDFRGSTDDGRSETDSGSRQLQPGMELLYQIPNLQIAARYDSIGVASENGSFENDRHLDRLSAFLAWKPEGIPGITLQADRRSASDDASGTDTVDDFALAMLDYEWRGLRAAVGERYSNYDDGYLEFARRSLDNVAQLSFDQSFLGGKLTTFANANANFSKLEERASGAVQIPNPVIIGRALYSLDDTPLDNRDRPLSVNPALTDFDVKTSAGISLGPDASSYHNIAVDLQRFTDVDEIRVLVRDRIGNPIRLASTVQWDAYTSDDGILWRSLQTQTSFNPVQSHYEISFPLINARWVKVVSFGVNAEETYVTEVQSYYHTTLESAGTRTTDLSLISGTAAVSAQPVRWLTLSYYGLFNSADQEPSDRPAISTDDVDHVGSIQLDPTRYLSVIGRYQTRSVQQTGIVSQKLDGWTGVVKLTPTRQLDLSVEANRLNEENQGRLIATDRIAFHTFARLFPTLDLTLEAGQQRQDFADDDRVANQDFATATLNARLTRTLRILFSGTSQHTDYEGSGTVLGLPPVRDDRWTTELYWRPGRPFTLSARYGWVSGEEVSGFTQRYRVEWYPFAEGSVSIGGTYDQDIDPYSNRKSSRVMFTPRWMINRHAMLDLNYTTVSITGDQEAETEMLYFTMTFTR